MARRYTRREFLFDASFALGSSVLLKVLAPSAHAATSVTSSSSAPATYPPRP